MVIPRTWAALLPVFSLAQASIVPERVRTVDPVPEGLKVEYRPASAKAAFSLGQPFGQSELVVSRAVSGNDACGKVSLNGTSLIASETRLLRDLLYVPGDRQFVLNSGSGTLPSTSAGGEVRIRWQNLCVTSNAGFLLSSTSTGVLSVELDRQAADAIYGFTISYLTGSTYTHRESPKFLRFSQDYIDIKRSGLNYGYWRSTERLEPSKKLEVSITNNSPLEADPEQIQSEQYKALFDSLIQHVKEKVNAIKSHAHKAFSTCHFHKIKSAAGKSIEKVETAFQSPSYQQTPLGSIVSDQPSSKPHPSQAHAPSPSQTRSLTSTASPPVPTARLHESSSPSSSPLSDLNPHINLQVISILFPCLILSSLLIWLFIRLRDPRRRAERAAEKEERRNQRLYRNAARCHKWKTFLCRLRSHVHNGGGCSDALLSGGEAGSGIIGRWDEKRSRVLQQETFLDTITNDEIRRLCHQTLPTRRPRPPSPTIATAEGYAFPDSRSLRSARSSHSLRSHPRRRQSGDSSSLPDYVSDITQPPGYDEELGFEDAMISDGWRYSPGSSNVPITRTRSRTPDSSIVDTSTRASARSSRSGSLNSAVGGGQKV